MQLSDVALQFLLGLEGHLALFTSEELRRPLVLPRVLLQGLLSGEAKSAILALVLLDAHDIIEYLSMDGGI